MQALNGAPFGVRFSTPKDENDGNGNDRHQDRIGTKITPIAPIDVDVGTPGIDGVVENGSQPYATFCIVKDPGKLN